MRISSHVKTIKRRKIKFFIKNHALGFLKFQPYEMQNKQYIILPEMTSLESTLADLSSSFGVCLRPGRRSPGLSLGNMDGTRSRRSSNIKATSNRSINWIYYNIKKLC